MTLAVRKMWVPLIVSSLVIFHGEALEKKRVCVIGAGRAGLAAIRIVADRSLNFKLIAFERKSDVGGLWLYSDETDLDEHGLPVHPSVYKNLKLNLPYDFMVYSDYLTFNNPENVEFVSHHLFLDYLRNYTNHFQLRKHIQFDSLVTKVSPIKGNGDWRTTTWRMDIWNLNANKNDSTVCDAVIICNGHYSKPNIPKIPGIETFHGRVLHSRAYRRPEDFSNQTVVLLGAGVSGIDITRDLSSHAKFVYLSHRHDSDPFSSGERPSNVQVVRGIVAVDNGKFVLQDNSTIVADTLMFCTGYLYDYPFLDEESGISIVKKEVCPLYDEEINAVHPTMAFIGLQDSILFGDESLQESDIFLDVLQGIESLGQREDCKIE